ncbi:MAG: 1-deoxy-D-xylulose-5-phosphate reductoisomerase, partial [Acutalibacteraceae bacterium]|nr:1-deoxy-D-xylulose-5-phosphate reductoisomerase [Acutalibacteraceae bacterium]
MAQKLSILGSTGSIGTQALDVVDMRGYEVIALTADSNYKLLSEQIRKYKPKYAALSNEKAAQQLRVLVADTGTKVLSGKDGVIECAVASESDTVLNSIVG